ncbi:MAG: phosphatidylglycerophosphatase A [Candidatus Aminicenantes bacterium]|nr:phosphatidylglycerophosphatase A [Candidatus Aminicenantes bacterium]
MKFFSKMISTFFGIGYAPLAPGTVASLCVVFLYKFFLYKLSWPYYLILLAAIFLIGILSSTLYARYSSMKDPQPVVIDEVLGQLLVFFQIAPDWRLLIAGFILFRAFDIIKPPPIRKIENLPEGWGIMLDDLLAGVYAGILINLYILIK